jgi:hypothetical protein
MSSHMNVDDRGYGSFRLSWIPRLELENKAKLRRTALALGPLKFDALTRSGVLGGVTRSSMSEERGLKAFRTTNTNDIQCTLGENYAPACTGIIGLEMTQAQERMIRN